MQVHRPKRGSMNQCVVATMIFIALLHSLSSPIGPVHHVLKLHNGKWMLNFCTISKHGVPMGTIVITKANVIQSCINPVQSPRRVIYQSLSLPYFVKRYQESMIGKGLRISFRPEEEIRCSRSLL